MAKWLDDATWYRGRLRSSDVVLHGDPAPPPQLKGARPPVFGPCLLWLNGWMDEGATWYGSRPQPRPHCVRWEPSSHHDRGTAQQPPSFQPMSVVATVAHQSYCWALVTNPVTKYEAVGISGLLQFRTWDMRKSVWYVLEPEQKFLVMPMETDPWLPDSQTRGLRKLVK